MDGKLKTTQKTDMVAKESSVQGLEQALNRSTNLTAGVSHFKAENAVADKPETIFSKLKFSHFIIALAIALAFFIHQSNQMSLDEATLLYKSFNYSEKIKRNDHTVEEIQKKVTVISDDDYSTHAYAESYGQNQVQVTLFHKTQTWLQFKTRMPSSLEDGNTTVNTIVQGCSMDNRDPIDLSKNDQRLLKKILDGIFLASQKQ
jgi:hypothetical protein